MAAIGADLGLLCRPDIRCGAAIFDCSPKCFAGGYLVPEPPHGQAGSRADAGATAMTDVSDGLRPTLGHIATASSVEYRLGHRRLRLPPTATEWPRRRAAVGADRVGVVLGGGYRTTRSSATFPGSARRPGWRTSRHGYSAPGGAPAVFGGRGAAVRTEIRAGSRSGPAAPAMLASRGPHARCGNLIEDG